MGEFKAATFIIFDRDGKAHKVTCDVIEGEPANFTVKGDPSLLAKRWRIMSNRIEMFLKGQTSEANRSK